MEELLENIFLLLDATLQRDSYFGELKKIVLSNFQGDSDNIRVSDDIYESLTEPLDIDITPLHEVEIITDTLSFIITKVNKQYMVELSLDKPDEIVSTLFTKSDWLSRIETLKIPISQGIYTDFDCQVYYYKDDIPLPINELNGEKDMVFSKEFGIPYPLCRYFRLHFKKFGSMIQHFLDTGEFDYFEQYLSEEDLYAFLRPFSILNFKEFMNEQIHADINGLLKEILIEHQEIDLFYHNELDFIWEQLASFLDPNGEIVLSYNLYQNFLLFLMGYTDVIHTNGILIQKVDNLYTLFYIAIYNNQVIVIPKCITDLEAKDIYLKNSLNQDVNGLATFFGVERERK